jgi:hypothetical protein
VASALAAANRTLPASKFVVLDGAIHHVANARLDEHGSLPPEAVELMLASTRVACEAHFEDLFQAAVGEPTPAASLPPGSGDFGGTRLGELRREVEAHRPSFAHRLERPVLVEDVENPWFRKHRLLFVQSPSPMPALGIVVAVTPAGRVRVLAGQPAALNEIAVAEGIELTDDEDALAYANLVTSWTRSADFPEMPVGSFDEIPFRRHLIEAERVDVERLRGEVGARVAPMSFVRTDGGWWLDVWLISVSRLVHQTVDLRADGTIDVRDEIVVPRLPVPSGAAWGVVDGRLVPIG